MKRGLLITSIVFAVMLLIFVIPMAAAPGNERSGTQTNDILENGIDQAWVVGPTMCFDWYRFDAEYYPGTGLVYIMGGRSGTVTDGTIYSFNPVTNECLATGATMPNPVSNYTINLVNDGINDLLCTFGGRDAAGGQTLNVQCYDPNANTVSVVTDLPIEWTGYVPGAQVVVDNMVYIFGGFNPTGPTYMTERTEKYDPATNTFTQVGDLNMARSYIMATAVDGIIYAFGGDTYPAGSLIAQTIAEKMDPAIGTWDDVGVADMPIAGDEGQAFSFDSSSPYPYANQIVIATLAQWSGASDEVILYDVATDTYDVGFPNLNNARRNHAGVLVPIDSPDPNDGLPGMWVIGGYLTGDSPPYAPAEFYPLPSGPTTCNILLVDDDWDFDTVIPNDGGRPYYTSTLDTLGYPYEVWDTVTQGDPVYSDMALYDAVIWFTGYDWQDPFNAANETEVAAYLDEGGSFFLSSQEYHYAFGLTPFLQNYLGVDNMTDDVIELDPVGNTGNPIGDGLGPYTMVRPDDWAAYWPTDEFEGPYDDYANPIIGAESPFRFNASAENNSTNLDAGTFKSIYLAFPFEWIDTVDERVEIMGPALDWLCGAPAVGEFYLTPPSQSGTGIAGETISYTLTIINSLGFDETFDLAYDSLWLTQGPASVMVPNGVTEDFVVTVTIPADGNCYEADTTTVTATSVTDPTDYKTALINSSVVPAGTGSVEGYIYDANTNLGIENGHLAIYVGDIWVEAYADADGAYTIPDVGACSYDGDANAYGYFDQYGLQVDVAVGDPTTFDLYLDASWPNLAGDPISVKVPPDTTDTYELTLSNGGTGDLYFHITEVPSGTYELPLYVDPAMPSGVDPQVYQAINASPDGTSKFIVYMRQQADLSAAYEMDWSARGQYVLDTLRNVATQTQADLVNNLNKRGVSYESRYIVNALVVSGNRAMVDFLASRPDVGYIGPNLAIPAPAPVSIDPVPTAPNAIEWNIQKVMADQVWSTYDVTGEGIVLSSIDTGVQWDHPALLNQYRGWDGMTANHNYNWWDPYDQNPAEPTDAHAHGTHTMGTMLGSDDPLDPLNATNAIGMAPGAKWMACDGFDNNTGYGYDAELLECAEFLLAPWDLTGQNPDPDMRPDIINNSWGGGQAQWWYNQAIYAWRAAGIMGVFSIGNPGSTCGMAGSPGDSANMIGVGATDINDTIASFSGRGPAAITGITKPDVSAPGVNIRSSVPGSSYQVNQGTSMAAPHVSGAVALIWSAVPELRGDVQITSWILEQTAFGLTTNEGCGGDLPDEIPNNTYGWGRINVFDAVSMALETDWDTSWLTVDPVGGTVLPFSSTDITLSFDTTGLVFGQCYVSDLMFEYNDPYVTNEIVPVELCIGYPNLFLPFINK
jgi:subtilisin family serine protease